MILIQIIQWWIYTNDTQINIETGTIATSPKTTSTSTDITALSDAYTPCFFRHWLRPREERRLHLIFPVRISPWDVTHSTRRSGSVNSRVIDIGSRCSCLTARAVRRSDAVFYRAKPAWWLPVSYLECYTCQLVTDVVQLLLLLLGTAALRVISDITGRRRHAAVNSIGSLSVFSWKPATTPMTTWLRSLAHVLHDARRYFYPR